MEYGQECLHWQRTGANSVAESARQDANVAEQVASVLHTLLPSSWMAWHASSWMPSDEQLVSYVRPSVALLVCLSYTKHTNIREKDQHLPIPLQDE
jgi:hypothetical protein